MLSVYAEDVDGHTTLIGRRGVQATNATATAPFGTIDTPAPGAVVSGTVVNFGWVLAPQPKRIPVDGSTIDVYIDGVNVGHPSYNHARQDIQSAFPGYANSNGAVGFFTFDSRAYPDGVHTIALDRHRRSGRRQWHRQPLLHHSQLDGVHRGDAVPARAPACRPRVGFAGHRPDRQRWSG